MRQAMASEYLHFRQSALEVKIAGALPEIPLIVLTRGRRQKALILHMLTRFNAFWRHQLR